MSANKFESLSQIPTKVEPQSRSLTKQESQSQGEEEFVKKDVTKLESGTKAEHTVLTTMLFSPDQKISDGILYLRKFFQKVLQDSHDKENRVSFEASRRRVSVRKRTREGTKVNYAALVGKRSKNVENEKSTEDVCLNNLQDVRPCVHRRQNMIKESTLPVPPAHTTRHTAKPDPTVYDFPKEWNPDSKLGILSLNSSALEIEGAIIQMDPGQMRDYHYAELLDTPISHRSGRNQTQRYFSSCLSSEKMRTTCIAKVAERLGNESSMHTNNRKRSPSEVEGTRRRGHRESDTMMTNTRKRGHRDSELVLKDAEKVVDDMLYLRELLEATESIKNQVQVIKRTFEERGLGTAPDISDPVALALELKSRLAKQCHIITEANVYTNNQL